MVEAAKIEITPERIDAGLGVLCGYEPRTGVSLADLGSGLIRATK
jgi:hypothetical protein